MVYFYLRMPITTQILNKRSRFTEWKEEQRRIKENVDQVFRHIHKRATPPPKAWWVPPLGLRTMLRLMLKSLNSTVVG